MMKPFSDEVWKAIPLKKLMEILAELPADSFVAANGVNNLTIFSEAGKELGYIDLAFDEYLAFD
jgi:hypothetical protein